MKKMLGMLVVAMVAVSAFGQNIYVRKSQDRTSKDLPFQYKEDKTVWEGDGVRMYGTVENTGSTAYRYVKVTFTASKSSGGFITREICYTDPNDIGPRQVGYVERFIDTGGEKPGKIEWVITGNEAR